MAKKVFVQFKEENTFFVVCVLCCPQPLTLYYLLYSFLMILPHLIFGNSPELNRRVKGNPREMRVRKKKLVAHMNLETRALLRGTVK